MSELRASVVMDLRGNLERQARRYEGAMRSMATNGQRHMTRLQRVTGGLGRQLDRVGNRWVALATGAAGVGTVRNLVALEERFTRLGIQSGRSAEEMEELRRQIFETARAPEIRVDPAQITGAIEAIVEKTGDLEFARENLRNIATAISATGAEGTNIGEILAEFQKMDIRAFDEVLRSIDTLNEQGKAGAFTLQNLASLGPRVVTAYTALGRQGPEAIREMGAALQVIRQGTGSSEQAATAFEALLRTFQDAEKAAELQRKSGVQIFDPEALREGREVLRPINELMVDIVEASRGRSSLLSGVFDAEAMRAFNAALGEYNRTGAVESMDRFLSVQGDGAATLEDSARAASTAGGALRNLSSAWRDFSDQNLSGPIQAAADALHSLDQETVDRWLKIGGAVAGLVASAYAVRSLGKLGVDLGRGARSVLRGSTTGGVASELGRTAGRMAPVPVYVTNWPIGGDLGGRRGRGRRTPTRRGPAGGTRTPTTRKGAGYTPPTSRHARPGPRTAPPAQRTPAPTPRTPDAAPRSTPAARPTPPPPARPTPRPAPEAPSSRPAPVPREVQKPSARPRLAPRALGAAASLGGRAIPVVGAGMAGWTIGEMLNEAMARSETGQRIGDTIGEAVAQVMAPFSEEARRALEINRRQESTVRVVIDQEGRVKSARPERGEGGPEIDVDLGNWRAWP